MPTTLYGQWIRPAMRGVWSAESDVMATQRQQFTRSHGEDLSIVLAGPVDPSSYSLSAGVTDEAGTVVIPSITPTTQSGQNTITIPLTADQTEHVLTGRQYVVWLWRTDTNSASLLATVVINLLTALFVAAGSNEWFVFSQPASNLNVALL